MGETSGRNRMLEPTAPTGEAPAPLTGRARAMGASPFPDSAAKHWILSSIIWLTVVDLFGLVLATEFVTPEAFSHYSWLSFSRVRPWHVMYLLGIIALLTGHSQGREYGEFIWPIDIALLVIWSANIVNILATVAIRTIRL